MKNIALICFFFYLAANYSFAQQKFEVKPTTEEMKLYKLINEYRKQNGLKEIPFSKSLTYVAQQHCKDLSENLGELTHAWSTCDYDASKSKTYPCMWLKPSELTSYKGYGYECAHGGNGDYLATATSSLEGWKSSKPHNEVILNKGIWKDMNWNAIGVGILNGYACIWFGVEEDKK
jgi:uncharacterized protein YkwD